MTHIAVVGGGPAGLMAAQVIAEAGKAVTVHDLHRSPGRKLLLAGRSGLNLTHSEPFETFLERYEPLPDVLAAALRAFPPDALQRWAAELGEETFVGSSGRVFPASFRAAPLLRAWLRRLRSLGVEFALGHRWAGWGDDGALVFATADGEISTRPAATVFALGGPSWPRVGSDAGWARAFDDAGVAVIPFRAANCGLAVDWTAVFRERFEGQPVKNVVIEVDGRRHRGEMVITADGIEGGPVYAASGALGRSGALPGVVHLDLAPDLPTARMVERLATRRPKDSQSTWLRRAGLTPVEIGLLREATGNRLPDDVDAMASLIGRVPLTIRSLMPIDRAISSAGGVDMAMLDDRLMLRSRPGTFVAGEMLDWHAPTGGYLLQACFASGAWAGRGVVAFLDR